MRRRGASAINPFADGAQVERTMLAWRRTALSVAVLSALAVRYVAPSLGWAGLVVAGGGVLLALAASVVIVVRFRRARRMRCDGTAPLGSGWPPTLVVGALWLLGVSVLGVIAFSSR